MIYLYWEIDLSLCTYVYATKVAGALSPELLHKIF